MTDEEKQISVSDLLFAALVRDFESMAMVGFGKLVDPVSQKAERNLERARVAIDMLGMLDEKTRGNLDATQSALMRQVLTNLRLNYVDEVEKEKKEHEKPEEHTGDGEAEPRASTGPVAGTEKPSSDSDSPSEYQAGAGTDGEREQGARVRGTAERDESPTASSGGESQAKSKATRAKSRKRGSGKNQEPRTPSSKKA